MDRDEPFRTERTLKVLAAIYAAKSATVFAQSLISFLIDAWAIHHEERLSLEMTDILRVIMLTLTNAVLFYLAVHVARSDRITEAIKRMAWVLAGMTLVSPIAILAVWAHLGLPDPTSAALMRVNKGLVASFIASLLSLFLGIWMARCLLRLRGNPDATKAS